jgi:hypothetical protein
MYYDHRSRELRGVPIIEIKEGTRCKPPRIAGNTSMVVWERLSVRRHDELHSHNPNE